MPPRIARAIVVVAAVVLAVLMHHTLLGPGVLPGEGGSDILRGWWSAWLIGHEVPGWPFDTEMVGFPRGADVVPFPAVSLIAMAGVSRFLGAATAVSFIVFGHTVFAVLATTWLVRTLGGGWGTGLLAGALVATQPVLGGALRDGTLEVLAVGWMPLTIACMLRACRGEFRFGLLAAVFFVATCAESVYYGSFTAVAVLGALTTVRTRRGLYAVGIAGVVVAVGIGLLVLAFMPVLDGMDRALATAHETDVRSQNATTWAMLEYFAQNPGGLGWNAGDIYGPPLLHLVVLAAGGLLALRRSPWLTVLGVFFLLLSMHHEWVMWWADGPLGSHIRFPRRYIAAVAVVLAPGLWWGSLPLRPWPKIELGIGLVLGGWLAWWGMASGGLVSAYPHIQIPSLTFAEVIAEDPEDAAVLFLPLWVPGGGGDVRTEQPVFASLGTDLASGDLLALQVLTDKSAWTAPSLVTLTEREGGPGVLAKNFNDLSFATVGKRIPESAIVDAESYTDELRWLMGLGMKYVVVDLERYAEGEQERIHEVFEPVMVSMKDYGAGTGVRVYTLYEERPEVVAVPAVASEVAEDAHFSGTVEGWTDLRGEVILEVQSSRGWQPCIVRRSDGWFDCGVIDRMRGVHIVIDGNEVEIELTGGGAESSIRVVQ